MGSLYTTKAVKEIFKENEQVTVAELYAKLVNNKTFAETLSQEEIKHSVRGSLYSLCKYGYIVRTGKGTYKLRT